MSRSTFELDRLRLELAHELPPECFNDFQRLSRSLLFGPPFQWLLVDAPADDLRRLVRARLDDVLAEADQRVSQLVLDDTIADARELEQALAKHSARSDVVHILGRRGWFDSARWDALNARRERLASQARARLVFWLDTDSIEAAVRFAPDLWAWRGGVYEFAATAARRHPRPPKLPGAALLDRLSSRSMTERHRRINEIEAWLAENRSSPDELRAHAYEELGELLLGLSYFDLALRHWRNVVLPFYRAQGLKLDESRTLRRIASVLGDQGKREEALDVLRNEALPLFLDGHGDDDDGSGILDIWLPIAEFLGRLGRYDEALEILQQKAQPIGDRLADPLSQATIAGKIADVFFERGDLDEALRARRNELSLYEKADAPHLRAFALGGIADILAARGEFDEALRIYREQVLPQFEGAENDQSRSAMLGGLAVVLDQSGRPAEALQVRQEELLPILDRLGNAQMRAVTQSFMAENLIALGDKPQGLRILEEDVLPSVEKLGRGLTLANTQARIASLLALLRPQEKERIGQLLRSAHAYYLAHADPLQADTEAMMRKLGIPIADKPRE